MNTRCPWWSYPLLFFPRSISDRLEGLVACGYVEAAPNLWQIVLGIWRMHYRLIFRANTIGTCEAFLVRSTWRARLLHPRLFRFPFLMYERAVTPLDLSGLVSGRERLIRHLIGAHHDERQHLYDLELLSTLPGALEELECRVTAVVEGTDPRSAWLRDLVVFERYHESLLRAVRQTLREGIQLSAEEARSADLSLRGYLGWCARQPASPRATYSAWRRGDFHLGQEV